MKCGRGAGGFAASGTTRFPDVADTAYYLDAASWAADSGLMNGYSDGRSGVNDAITRQQVTAIFWRWAGSPESSAEDYAGEDAVSGYAKTAVDWARANGIVPQREENRFAPAESATRGEIAQILYNYHHQSGQPAAPSAGGGKVLAAYFSATGSTEAVANTIAGTLNADTFAITPANPYSAAGLDWTDPASRVNAERNAALVQDTVDNWADYDVVFIGYPIWWGIAAWPVDTFVKANDFTGKTVIPFCTSAFSGLGQSGRLLAEMANSGDWQEGQRFSSGVPAATVSAWAGGTEPPRRRGPERTAGGLRSGNGGGIFAGDSAPARKKTRGRLSQAVPFSPAGQFRPGLPGRGRSCPGHFPRPPPEPGGTAGRSRPRPEARR